MQEPLNIGIDVAKAELVIGVVDHPEWNGSIANTPAQMGRWLDRVPTGSRLAVESTGRYHKQFVELAQERGLLTYVLNARDVHFYAKALGQRGKTDRTDAQVISRYVKEHHARLHPFVAGGQVEQQIELLLNRRTLLSKQRDGLRLSLSDLPVLDKPVQALLTEYERVIGALDEQIALQIQSQEQLVRESERLQTVPGIGTQGAAMLLCLFRRIPFQRIDALIAFAGLDPRPMDSGQKRGKRKLSKRGPALLRRQVYLIGFAASRSVTCRDHYQGLRARGFSSTAAFVMLGRKLLRAAFAVWRGQTCFDAKQFASNTTCARL